MSLEVKARALNNYRVLHLKLPSELFGLIITTHHQDVDLWASLQFIRALENEGWIKREAPKA
jgi:hypothetical protein